MKMRRDLAIGTALGIVAAFGYAFTSVLVKRGVTDLATPLAGATVALLSGAMILSLTTVIIPESRLSRKKSAVGFFLIAGLISGGGVSSIYFALSHAPVVLVAPITSTSPLIAILWSSIFLKQLEKITPRLVLGATLVVIGAILISIDREV